MYGGRAIDDFDRRVLKTYMDEYMGDFIFDTFQPFHFFHNEHVDYLIPPEGNKDSYMAVIEELPLANTPEVFGLHTNAEINYFTHATKSMWAQLVELQPQTGETGSGISREEFISNIATDIQVHTQTHTSFFFKHNCSHRLCVVIESLGVMIFEIISTVCFINHCRANVFSCYFSSSEQTS